MGTGEPSTGVIVRMDPEQIGDWVLHELPRLNQAILHGQAPPGLLVTELREHVLPRLPGVARLTPVQAQQLVVHLGLAGASVARHHQDSTPHGTEHPERAFGGLHTGDGLPFRSYFAALAEHTGTGHYVRDSYASLVRWNVGTVRVRLRGEVVAELPGVFDDGRIRSYTGTVGEREFFRVVKQGEAIELAVNRMLESLTAPDVELTGEYAHHRVRAATVLLDALRVLLTDFTRLPPDRAMTAGLFMDVFRQFAAHWTIGDIPPSGALDPEAVKRDYLLGTTEPGYDRRTRYLLPAMLEREREEISVLMDAPALPHRLLGEIGESPPALAGAGEADLRRLVARHPALAGWYRLLTMNARVSGVHLGLSRKLLFAPQRHRDETGFGDPHPVSNRAGTTGLTETHLERLTRARRDHALAALRPVLTGDRAPAGPSGGTPVTLEPAV